MTRLVQLGLYIALLTGLANASAATVKSPKIHARVLDGPESVQDTYDYVVIGGGTAGLTVGDRLSEDGENTVLVIEHGEMTNSEAINSVRDRLTWDFQLRWFYNITSAPNTELNNLESLVYIGNVVGGSSAINGMQCVRGTVEDYDRWGSFFGPDSSWTWEGMLRYFKKAMHFQPPSDTAVAQMPGLKYDASYWGNSSRVYAGWPSFQWPGIKYQFELFQELSGVQIPDDSGAGQTGVFWYPTFIDAEGSINRSYSQTGHWDGLNRANYDLLPLSKVTKINLDRNRATGVTFRPSTSHSNPKLTTVHARKEVILSAGTIHSPQVLQLSGIGPRNLLDSAGIDTKVDLPGVGQNFHDHTTLTMDIKFQNYTTRPNRRDDLTHPDFIAWADTLWETNRTGPWSRGIWNTGAWLAMPTIAPDTYETIAGKIDAQHAADYLPAGSDPTVIAGYQARLTSLAAALRSPNSIIYSHYFSGDEPVNYFTYEHPLSLGTININVSAPEAAEPVVDYRTYSNPVDFDVVVELARFHRRVNVESERLETFGPVEVSPGANVTAWEDWMEYIRGHTDPTAMHPVGTCAMMPLDLGGVVDEELRVYGVEGLRVVDASVMNVVIGANLAATVFAVAEKGADLIKGE